MKNWKTFLAGIGAAGLNLFANGVAWKQVLFSVAIATVGSLAKDFNVTGGNSPATPEAERRVQ